MYTKCRCACACGMILRIAVRIQTLGVETPFSLVQKCLWERRSHTKISLGTPLHANARSVELTIASCFIMFIHNMKCIWHWLSLQIGLWISRNTDWRGFTLCVYSIDNSSANTSATLSHAVDRLVRSTWLCWCFAIDDDGDAPANRHASAARHARGADYLNQNQSKQH